MDHGGEFGPVGHTLGVDFRFHELVRAHGKL